jgi:hypothetical protein
MSLDHHFEEPTAIRTNLGAIFVSLELSRSTWLITSLSPRGGEKMSKHGVSAGNIAALLMRLSELKQKAFARTSSLFRRRGWMGFGFIACCSARGLRAMSSIRPQLRPHDAGGGPKPTRSTAKPWCALCWRTNAVNRGSAPWSGRPKPEDEDRRRLCRERKTLTNERVQHVNRIKGLLFSQGIFDYAPLRRDRRQRHDLAAVRWQIVELAVRKPTSLPDNAQFRHVERVWRCRPRFDARAGLFHVIDDPIFAVGAEGEFEFARPADNGLRAQGRGAGAVNLPLGRPPASLAHNEPRLHIEFKLGGFRRSGEAADKPGMPTDRRRHGLSRAHFDAERRPAHAEFGALDYPARPRPGVAKFDAQCAVAGDLPRPTRDQPVQGVGPAVGGEAVPGLAVIQARVTQPANPRRESKTSLPCATTSS